MRPPRFALAGLSMGGIVAMEIAAGARALAGIALLDTNPLAERPRCKPRRAPQIAGARAGGLDARDARGDEAELPCRRAGPQASSTCAWRWRSRWAPMSSPPVIARLADRPDRTRRLRGLDMPALVLCGRHDALCPIERHVLMHDLMPRSRCWRSSPARAICPRWKTPKTQMQRSRAGWRIDDDPSF